MSKRTPIQRGLWFTIPFFVGLIIWVSNELLSDATSGVISTSSLVLFVVGGVGMLVCAIENAFR